MFGMNAKDALGRMEDAAMIGAAHRAADERSLIRSATMELDRQAGELKTMESVAKFVAIKERDNRLVALQQDRNNQVIHATALQKTLDHVIRDFAKLAGVSEDQLRARYNTVRTQHYNACVNEGMAKGWFEEDPRFRLSDKSKAWYEKGLDTDHGF